MRTRHEIELDEVSLMGNSYYDISNKYQNDLTIELLLDIRDLLAKDSKQV